MKIQKRRSDRSGRAPLSSPGRPSVAGRDERRRFWAAIAVGLESEDAALEAGVPPSPEQIARRLPVDFPDDDTMRISHEAIYQALFVQGRGALHIGGAHDSLHSVAAPATHAGLRPRRDV